tara:strand:+ start:137 stop:364 length:228 start_codon:yes stop_codon:yes gene_type:complete
MDLNEDDVQWYSEEFNMSREEVIDMLECLDPSSIKEEFWQANPNMPEAIVDDVVRKNISASFEYHQYRTFNNEAS